MSLKTSEDIILAALKKLGVKSSYAELTDEEKERGLYNLHLLFADLENRGYKFSITYQTDSTKEIYIDRTAKSAIVHNLVIYLASEYDITPSSATIKISKDSLRGLRVKEFESYPIRFPSNMPMGAGNSSGSYSFRREFFPEACTSLSKNGMNLTNEMDQMLCLSLPNEYS